MEIELLKSVGLVTGPLSLLAFLAIIVLFIYRNTVNPDSNVAGRTYQLLNKKLKGREFYNLLGRVLLYVFIITMVFVILSFVAYIIPLVIPPPATSGVEGSPTAIITMESTNAETETPTSTVALTSTSSSSITPALTEAKATNLLSGITDCIPDTWFVFEKTLYESPIILPKINNANDCVDGSEYGFFMKENPINHANSLNVKWEISEQKAERTYVYLSSSIENQDGEIELSLYIQNIESFKKCDHPDGSCDVDLVIGIGKYPSYSEGQFIVYRVKSQFPSDISTCRLPSIEYPCLVKSAYWIETFSQQKSVRDRRIVFKILENELFINYNGDPIFRQTLKRIDKVFWIGYDISVMGRINAYVTFF
jgi:hypothetical protein